MWDEQPFFDKKFGLILSDTVLFLEESEKEQSSAACLVKPGETCHNKDSWPHLLREATFARAAIMGSALILETSANCCIHSLNLQEELFECIDKKPPLDKFQFYLKQIDPNKKFDRGVPKVQDAREIIKLRDGLVHPKPFTCKLKDLDAETQSLELGESERLKLPMSLYLCRHEYALTSFKASMSFLNLFFRDLCGYIYYQVHPIVFGNEIQGQHSREWVGIRNKWGVEVDFLIASDSEHEQTMQRLREHLINESLKYKIGVQ